MAKRKFDCFKKRGVDFGNPSPEDIAELEKAIAKYFDSCDRENKDKMTKPYTLPGLLYSIRVTKEEFALLLGGSGASLAERAMLKIEAFLEENALNGKLPSTAAMNSLKNSFGEDKQQAKAAEISVTLDEASTRLGE